MTIAERRTLKGDHMEEVIKAVNGQMTGTQDANFTGVAKDWAGYCLANHVGNLLEAGLRLSKALAEYDYLLKTPDECTTL
jgi:hypothetical protein